VAALIRAASTISAYENMLAAEFKCRRACRIQ
jgi:hypothetical protein